VLSAWQQSPARFRADANLEDDLALVGYRDRVIVELAQNAADAATRAGIAGRLVLDLSGDVLSATNTGSPLDAAGVESIAVARASAKRNQPGTVGRFGVGFAAVLSVTDEPSIRSRTGSVRWSRADAGAAVAEVTELAGELAERDGRAPVLRLPFEADGSAADDGDTTVVLPLRDADAISAVRQQLGGLDAALLFALPALGEVVVRIDGDERVLRAERFGDDVVVSDGSTASRWWVVEAEGQLDPDLLSDRPAEERTADRWQLTWALPVTADGALAELPASIVRVVHAPTATDDPLTVPAVLVASYPLDATRRRVTTGPLADSVTAAAAEVLVAALADRRLDPSYLRIVPAGFPDGALDGAMHTALLGELRATAWLPVAGDDAVRQRPSDAVVVADSLVPVLRDVVPALLPVGWSRPELAALAPHRPTLAELVDAVSAVDAQPSWWCALYAALDDAVPAGPERDALGALPVPLADGRLVTGPRGLVLPSDTTPAVDLSAIGIRVVHPGAAHELLRSLGAGDGTPRGLLEQPQVRTAVEASYDDDDPEPVAAAVLALVAAAGVDVEELPWLAELALPDDDDDWRPAGELLLPGGRMAQLAAPDSPFGRVDPTWLGRWGASTLVAAGVVDEPVLLRDLDATGPTHDLDHEAAWWAELPHGASLEEFVAVRDLEQVREGGLGDLLDLLAAPPLRAAVVEPALVSAPDGTVLRVPSYTAWWLSTEPVLDGRPPRGLRLPGGDPALAGLYDDAPDRYDVEFLRALGVLARLDDADADDVLGRLADRSRLVSRAQLRSIYGWLAGRSFPPPAGLRAIREGEPVVVPVADAVVVDAPDLHPLLGGLAIVPVVADRATELAGSLGIRCASEMGEFPVTSAGDADGDIVLHEQLRVRDLNGVEQEVPWRLAGGVLHVDRRHRAFGVGRGRAWRDGQWALRHRRTEELNDPGMGKFLESEDDLDQPDEE